MDYCRCCGSALDSEGGCANRCQVPVARVLMGWTYCRPAHVSHMTVRRWAATFISVLPTEKDCTGARTYRTAMGYAHS